MKYIRVKTHIRNNVGYEINNKAIQLPFHSGGVMGEHDDHCGNIVSANINPTIQLINQSMCGDIGLISTWLWMFS